MEYSIANRIVRILFLSSVLLLIPLCTATVSALIWSNESVDTASVYDVLDDPSLALDTQGNPRISYCIVTQNAVRYAWRDGSGWHTETVGAGEYNEAGSSLALDITGNPRISYRSGGLRYAWRDAAGWHNETVEAPGFKQGTTSLALDNAGNPRFIYNARIVLWEANYLNQSYAWRDVSGWHTESVDAREELFGDTPEDRPCLALDATGNPRLSYAYGNWWYGGWHYDLKYAWRDTSGWHTETVDQDVGIDSSLRLDAAGNPRISYYDQNEDCLRYAWRDSFGWHHETVDPVAGLDSSLALDAAGNPRISYWNQGVKYAWRDNQGWHNETVDSLTYAGDSSLVLDSAGNPRITYFDRDHKILKYIWANSSSSGMVAFPGASGVPTDTNADGSYEDVNGNGRPDFADVVLYFNQMSWITANEPLSAFDYNGNGRIDFADVVWLFNHL